MALLNLQPQDNLPDSPGSSAFDLPTQQERNGFAADTSPSGQHTPQSRGHVPATGLEIPSTPDGGPSFLVISGGTGGNSICSAFGNATYVLPVSDDGGSSSEIIRVIGGPSVGKRRIRYRRNILFLTSSEQVIFVLD